MKLLFVCSQNRMRSPTGEAIFSGHPVHVARSGGTDVDAVKPISAELIEWADIVFPMEGLHFRRLHEQFPSQMQAKRTIVLKIRDDYEFMDPALIARLKSRLREHIEV